jgi:hypothetical protein
MEHFREGEHASNIGKRSSNHISHARNMIKYLNLASVDAG